MAEHKLLFIFSSLLLSLLSTRDCTDFGKEISSLHQHLQQQINNPEMLSVLIVPVRVRAGNQNAAQMFLTIRMKGIFVELGTQT